MTAYKQTIVSNQVYIGTGSGQGLCISNDNITFFFLKIFNDVYIPLKSITELSNVDFYRNCLRVKYEKSKYSVILY